MAIQFNRKDIQIMTQVVFKEWCAIHKRLPAAKVDFTDINQCSRRLWRECEIAAEDVERTLKNTTKPLDEIDGYQESANPAQPF